MVASLYAYLEAKIISELARFVVANTFANAEGAAPAVVTKAREGTLV